LGKAKQSFCIIRTFCITTPWLGPLNGSGSGCDFLADCELEGTQRIAVQCPAGLKPGAYKPATKVWQARVALPSNQMKTGV